MKEERERARNGIWTTDGGPCDFQTHKDSRLDVDEEYLRKDDWGQRSLTAFAEELASRKDVDRRTLHMV